MPAAKRHEFRRAPFSRPHKSPDSQPRAPSQKIIPRAGKSPAPARSPKDCSHSTAQTPPRRPPSALQNNSHKIQSRVSPHPKYAGSAQSPPPSPHPFRFPRREQERCHPARSPALFLPVPRLPDGRGTQGGICFPLESSPRRRRTRGLPWKGGASAPPSAPPLLQGV